MIEAVVFDVFGTLADYRASVARQCRKLFDERGIKTDEYTFTDMWRSYYGPYMERVRQGMYKWSTLDVLHRLMLSETLARNAIEIDEKDKNTMCSFWHNLEVWPDVPNGLERIRSTHYVAPLSNANVAMMVNISRYANLQWDCVLGAELVQHYKPDQEVYQSVSRFLPVTTDKTLMVAAHASDLRAAKACGLKTAYVHRPLATGQQYDFSKTAGYAEEFDLVVNDLNELAVMIHTIDSPGGLAANE